MVVQRRQRGESYVQHGPCMEERVAQAWDSTFHIICKLVSTNGARYVKKSSHVNNEDERPRVSRHTEVWLGAETLSFWALTLSEAIDEEEPRGRLFVVIALAAKQAASHRSTYRTMSFATSPSGRFSTHTCMSMAAIASPRLEHAG